MQKHKFNIFPEMSNEEYEQLKSDIKANGFDKSQPIITFEGAIIDGWNRYQACCDLDVEPITKPFDGNSIEAMQYVLRTNKRRNLNSGQWACIAVDADEIINQLKDDVEKARREKQAETQSVTKKRLLGNKLPDSLPLDPEPETINNLWDATPTEKVIYETLKPVTAHGISMAQGITWEEHDGQVDTKKDDYSTRTASKLAKEFETNHVYIKTAAKLKESNPEVFAQIRDGEISMTKAIKQEQIQKKKEEIETTLKSEIKDNKPLVQCKDVNEFLNQFDDGSVDLLITDPPYSTDVDDINKFAESWLNNALKKVKDSGYAFVFIGAYPEEINAYLNVAMPTQLLVWEYKNTLGQNPKDRYKLNYQAILFYRMSNAGSLNIDITNEQWAVQSINAPDGRLGDRYHAWQKPIELADRLIRHTTNTGEKVIDPFCCTGTFLLAASKLNRNALGSDISDDNLKIAVQRGCQYA